MDTNAENDGDSPSQYKRLFDEIRRRTMTPASHPPFLMYFLVVMIVISPLNVWVEIGTYLLDLFAPLPSPPGTGSQATLSGDGIRTALLTFFPAVAASTAMQLILAAARKDIRAFAMFVFTGLAIMTLIAAPSRIPNGLAITIGVLATLISLWLWWIANADQTDLLGDSSPAAPIGGDDERKPLRGNLDGFEV